MVMELLFFVRKWILVSCLLVCGFTLALLLRQSFQVGKLRWPFLFAFPPPPPQICLPIFAVVAFNCLIKPKNAFI